MALADDIASDYLIIDGVETVTYTPRGGAAITTAKGLRRPVRRGPVNTGGSYPGDEVRSAVWHVWVSTLTAGVVCKPGDTILDTRGATWIVKSVGEETLLTRWRLECVESQT